MSVKVELDQSVFRDVITGHAQRVIRDVIDDLKRLIIQSFGQAKTGRFYPRPKPARGTYRASAPGQAPAIRSGRLFRSLKETFPTPLSGELLVDTPYARILEEKIDRPFVRPAIESVKQRFASGSLGGFR